MREVVELVLFEASDLEDFLDSGSQENIADSGKEFVPADLEADLSDSDNNIIFIIGIRATSRINLSFFYCVWTVPALLLRQKGIWYDYDSMDYLSDKYTSQVFKKCVCLLYYA